MFGRAKRRRKEAEGASVDSEQPSLELIAQKLNRLVWRRRLWGVDERQAWHVIQRMDEMYRQLYREQHVHYEALLQQARGGKPQVGNLPSLQPQVQRSVPVASAQSSVAEQMGVTAGIPTQRVQRAGRIPVHRPQGAVSQNARLARTRSVPKGSPKAARVLKPRHARPQR